MKIQDAAGEAARDLNKQVRALLSKRPLSRNELSEELTCDIASINSVLKSLRSQGANISELIGGKLFLHSLLQQGGSLTLQAKDRGDGWTAVGFVTDNHLGNRHSRLDVLNAAYDFYEREGVTTVLNAGNWVDGEARFNRHELVVAPGMDPQLDYAIERYPQRKGITTHYITGDDHEGWWIQRECVNVGEYFQMRAEKAGRTDLRYMGHVEADIRLKCGKGSAVGRIMHPGGGSAYALSYAPQKLVESFQGGEKPSLLWIGHYHKFDWCVPLESEILTRGGWRKYNDLADVTEVLGYNLDSDQCEWTPLIGSLVMYDQPLVRYSNNIFDVRCTPDHKWPLIKKFQTIASLGTIDETNCQPRIVQAAVAPDGPGLGNLPIQRLLDRESGSRWVLSMTAAERQAFIVGMMFGEGNIAGGGTLKFNQNPGPVADAFRLACALQGIATSTGATNGSSDCIRTALLQKRHRETRALKREDAGRADVWCPQTKLRTWVMRQGSTITITGNCYPREVHCISGGCTCDQSAFLRKNKIGVHVGFGMTKIQQDKTDGHVTRVQHEWLPYYDRGYYEKRFG